jgi:hypothetical protein
LFPEHLIEVLREVLTPEIDLPTLIKEAVDAAFIESRINVPSVVTLLARK